MKVFISWSGEKSKAVAAALYEWIPGILNNAKPWMSDLDIESGQDWNQRITSELDATSFGIICVTPENQARPWLNYEAGALSKQVKGDEARVAPLLIDFTTPTDLTGPLTKFHARLANREGIRRLVFDMNTHLPDSVKDEILTRTFEALWPHLSDDLDRINQANSSPQAVRREDRDVMDEVLTLVRGIHTAVRVEPDSPVRLGLGSPQSTPTGVYSVIKSALREAGYKGGMITSTSASRVKVTTDEVLSEAVLNSAHVAARDIGLKFVWEHNPDEVEQFMSDGELHEAVQNSGSNWEN